MEEIDKYRAMRAHREMNRYKMRQTKVYLLPADFDDFSDYCRRNGTNKQAVLESYVRELLGKGARQQ